MTARDETGIPIAADNELILLGHLDQNQSAVIVCAFNLVDQDMFRFYLPASMSPNQIWQYPSLAVDAYTPNFNITQFVNLCEQRNVKYLILYDYGSNTPVLQHYVNLRRHSPDDLQHRQVRSPNGPAVLRPNAQQALSGTVQPNPNLDLADF